MVDGTRKADDLDKRLDHCGGLKDGNMLLFFVLFLASELFKEGKGVWFLKTSGEKNRKKQRLRDSSSEKHWMFQKYFSGTRYF